MTCSNWWRGKHGDDYTDRNKPNAAARIELWQAIIAQSGIIPKSVLEVGANVGQNLMALDAIISDLDMYAVEPNAKAARALADCGLLPHGHVNIATADKMPFASNTIDLVFTSGVLIHIPPEDVIASMAEMYRISKRTIVCIEYFSPELEMKVYQGETNRLWKCDYGSLWLNNFNLKTLDYGFVWKRATGLDNLTWWAFEKV